MSPEEWLAQQPKTPATQTAPVSPEQWATTQPEFNLYDVAAQYAPPPEEPATTAAGVAGAATRGLAPVAAGAALGAAMGAPIGGVGAIPGALAGAGAAGLAQLVGDPVVGAINNMFGTKYTLPTDAMEDLLTRVGVPEPRTAAERIVKTAAQGAGGGLGGVALGQTMMRQTSPLMQGIGAHLAAQAPAQVVGGFTGGGSAATARELGAGPVGQTIAGLVGGVGGGMAASRPGVVSAVQQAPGRVVEAAKAAPRVITRVAAGAPSQKAVEATRGLLTDPYNADFAGYKIPTGGATAVVDDAAKEAMRQGWRPKFVSALKASSPEDYSAARKMLNLWELGSKRANIDKRPTDIVGDTMLKRIDYIDSVRTRAGKELETAANGLKGKAVDFTPAIDNFIGRLEKLGVSVGQNVDNPDFTVGNMKVSLRGSAIEGDEGSKRLLETVFKRLSTDTPDGYGVHTAKRWIDNQVEYGKKSASGLLGDTERAVKALRADLNQSLREHSPEYAKANTKYSDTINAMESLRNSIGSKVDLEGANANKALGTEARKLLSNYQARVNMLTAIDDIEKVAKRYGMKIDDSISNQIIVANEIDRMFGAVAEGSFKGQIEQALTTGVKAARGNVTGVAMDLAGSAIDRVRGINEKNAVAALRKLLSEKQTIEMPPGTAMVKGAK